MSKSKEDLNIFQLKISGDSRTESFSDCCVVRKSLVGRSSGLDPESMRCASAVDLACKLKSSGRKVPLVSMGCPGAGQINEVFS
jgi:hypothetical protein